MFDKPVDLNKTYSVKRIYKSKPSLVPESIKKPLKHKKTIKRKSITEKQAKYIIDMKFAREMRRWI